MSGWQTEWGSYVNSGGDCLKRAEPEILVPPDLFILFVKTKEKCKN